MKYLFKLIVIILCSSVLSGCNSTSTTKSSSESIAGLHDFNKVMVKGGDFLITTYQKVTDKNASYVFYIEGDGSPFEGKYKISLNPTPRQRTFVNLATMDKRPNVIYIARPCQYTPMEANPKCTNLYWTSRRLSDDSVDALNQVINSINNGQPFSLIGYSGGGGIAVLIAARNNKVKDIITVAGNLDHVAFTSYHNVTPMIDSLNPINFAEKINMIPQLHVSGAKDTKVPPFIADKFVKASASVCVKNRTFQGVSHNKGWDKIWEHILNIPLNCHNL